MRNDSENNSVTQPDQLELALRSLAPVAPAIDRDKLMFLAGMRAAEAAQVELASGSWRRTIWPLVSLVSTAAAVVLTILFVPRTERVVIVERESPESIVMPQSESEDEPPQQSGFVEYETTLNSIAPEQNYLLRRQQMLMLGADAMGTSYTAGVSSASSPATQRELLQEFYGPPPTQTQAGSWWDPWLLPGDRS